MSLWIVMGAQWGDEGKGRIVDMLAEDADMVARFSGGDNAGHTIRLGETVYKLHLVPSGIIYPQTTCVMGNGMVINPAVLKEEIESLQKAGVTVNTQRLKISQAAHIITPAHRALDGASEKKLGDRKIGTTGRGISPAYYEKVKRVGLRFVDMLNRDGFKANLTHNLENTNRELTLLYGAEPLDVKSIVADYLGYAEMFTPYIADVSGLVVDALATGKKVIAEGAQGALLDIDLGSYPYVTSSSCQAANALLGLGIGIPKDVTTIGLVKAFQTRVGEGAFPTELFDETADFLRGDGTKQWDEYGTTTGRARRIGWLDGVQLRRVVITNSINALALTKLDVLSGLKEIKVCTGYAALADERFAWISAEPARLVYESLPGWQEDLMGVRTWKDLPGQAQEYVHFIEKISGVPVRYISVGPERSQVIIR